MMPAAKMFDPIVGVDVHMIQPPGPVPPVPVPHPHTGILFDPFDLAPYIGATVTVGGIPRAVAGSGTKMIPSHIPIGGTFIKPPANDSELFMGSSTVLADGEPFGYLALPLLSCWDVGMPPIPRPARSLLPSLVLPTTVVMAVPSGVTVGGSPTVSMSALADRVGLGPLMAAYEFAATGNPLALIGLAGPFLKGLKKANKKFKFVKKSKCGKGVKLFNGKLSIGGDPVNLVTGEVIDDVVDALEPGGLFRWERFYGSSKCDRLGPLGYGFTHGYEHTLELYPQAWRYRDPSDTEIDFDPPTATQPVQRNAGMTLRLIGTAMVEVAYRDEPRLRFALPEDRRRGQARLVEVASDTRSLQLVWDGDRLQGFVERDAKGEAPEVRFTLEYDDADRIIGVWRRGDGPAVCLARYGYIRASSLLERTQDAEGRRTHYAFDDERRLVARTDPGGYTFVWRYDDRGRCVETSGRDGLWATKLAYAPDLRETYEWRDGERFVIRYDANGRITEQIAPDGSTLRREIDDAGRVVREDDAAGREMRWCYDGDGAHTGRVDGLGNAFPPEWDAPDLADPLAPTWPETPFARELGGEPGAERPHSAWLLRRLHRDAQSEAYGLIARRLPPTEPREKLDRLGRVVERWDSRGHVEQLTYAHGDHPVERIDRDGKRWTARCARWNLLTEEADPLGNTTQYAYDAREHVTGITDANGNCTSYRWDALDRLVEIRRPSGIEETRVYDEHDRLAKVLDSTGAVLVELDYDRRGLETQRKLEGGRVHTLRHDAAGNPVELSTDAHRVTLRWDREGVVLEDMVDGRGLKRTGPSHHRTTTLFDRFLVTHRTLLGQDAWQIVGPTGEVHRITRTGPHVVREHVDAAQELSTYDDEGRCLGRVRCSIDYDGRASVHRVEYRYSGEGDLLEADDSAVGSTRWICDDAHRLVAEIGPHGRIDYAHDPAGNLLAKPGLSGVRVGPDNQLLATDDETFVYDARFQLVERRRGDAVVRYRYDALGQLVEVDDGRGDPWVAEHDAWGRRIRCGRGDAQRQYVWDGERIAAEIDPEGRLRIYLYATEAARQPTAFVDYESVEADPADGRVYFVFGDASGLPRRIESEYGECVWSAARVDAYGEIEVAPGSTLDYSPRWPGHHRDPDTGLHYNRYRDYDAGLGRYLQTDPAGQAGGINLYAYPSNPLVDVDVLGLSKGCGARSRGTSGSGRPSKSPPPTKTKTKPAKGGDTGPPPRKPGEPICKRYGLTSDQRKHFRDKKNAAKGDPDALEDMRYERTQTRRRNKGQEEYPSKDAWREDTAKRNASGNRQRGNEVEQTTRPGVSDHVGRPLESGNSFPDPERPGKTTKYEPTVTMPDGKKVKTRPDGITKGPDGHPDPSGVVVDNKHFMGGTKDQKYPETQQLAAQRQLAESHGGKHVVSLTSDAPDLGASPPRPRPDDKLGGSSSEVVYADPTTGDVTHVWNPKSQTWDPK